MHPQLIEIPRQFEAPEPEIDEHINEEILADAYGDEEVFSSWYYYLSEALNFPFTAIVNTHQIGGTLHSSKVRLVAMSPMSRCGYWQMWAIGHLSVQEGVLLHFFLSDIAEAEEDPERITALADWNYWRRDLHDEMWEE